MDADNHLTNFVIIGRVTKPHGVRGALKVEPLTDDPRRFELLKTVFLGSEEKPQAEFHVARVQFSSKQVLLTLQEISTFEAADVWRNRYVHIPAAAVLPLADDEHYYFELAGLTVYTDDDRYIGRVHDVVPYPANDMFVIHADDGREILIPDVPAFIREVNVEQGKLIITPIDGLLD